MTWDGVLLTPFHVEPVLLAVAPNTSYTNVSRIGIPPFLKPSVVEGSALAEYPFKLVVTRFTEIAPKLVSCMNNCHTAIIYKLYRLAQPR